MLAREAAGPFDDPGFLFEVKWDGYRALLERDGAGHLHLWGRSGRDLAPELPALASGLARELGAPCLLDGEIVALRDGQSDMARLQSRREPLVFVAFDLLRVAGRDLLSLPLWERRAELAAVPQGERLVRSEGVVGEGRAYFRAIRARDLEGMMAKDLGAPYRPGARTRSWLKVLNRIEERFAVVAAEVPGPGRVAALWLGDAAGRPVARVAGIPPRDAAEVLARLDGGGPAGAAWPVRPGLCCRVRHRGRGPGGALRHAKYERLEVGRRP